MVNYEFYKGKKVLVTGHTGFKGAWLCLYLIKLGANVCGYALKPTEKTCLFYLTSLDKRMKSVIGDIRNYELLKRTFDEFEPEIVIHMAAQPIVLESYKNPKYTYETNVLGALNVMECVRFCKSVKSFLNVTTEKVYENKELKDVVIDETFPLDGYDPYSNSKSCSELITNTYKRCFFEKNECAISTARTSNVIGGGDFSANRVIPDCVAAAILGKKIIVRNPNSYRPYQFILDPLTVYLEICEKQYNEKKYQNAYNVAPDEATKTEDLVASFCKQWGNGLSWTTTNNMESPYEAQLLIVSNERLRKTFDWSQKIDIHKGVELVIRWTKCYVKNPEKLVDEMIEEINYFMEL